MLDDLLFHREQLVEKVRGSQTFGKIRLEIFQPSNLKPIKDSFDQG